MLAEDDEEGALTTLADLAGSRRGKGEGLQGGEEVDDQGEDDILIQDDSLEENEKDDNEEQEEEKKENAEEQGQEYTGPAVVEYEHDVAIPNLMTGEQFEAAMEAQFLQPHRVSMQARRTVLKQKAREGGDDPAGNDALVLFALLRPHPTRWWSLDAAKANFFLTEQELTSMHVAAEPMAKKGPISIEGSSPEADDFRFRSGGLQGPLFREVQLLETAIAKYGRSGFLRRRLEADELLTNVRHAYPRLPPSLPQRLARARQAFWASRNDIAYSPSALVNIQNEGGREGGREGRTRWWTIPAALAGFKLNWMDLKKIPLRRYVVPMEEGGEEGEGGREGGAAFDFGMLVKESAVVALAKKLQKGRYNEYRKKARKRGLWVEWMRERYQEAVEEGMERGEGDEWLVDCVEGCAFGWHQTTTDTYNASRSVSSVSDLVGVKWVTRTMAQELFNLSTAELALLPRLPGLDPSHTGVAGDLFNERDLHVLSNACVMHGWPFALRRKGLETKALQEVAWKTVERREGLREEAEDEEEEGEEEGEGFVGVMLGMEEGEEEEGGEEGRKISRRFLQRAVGKHGGIEGFLRYRVKVECAMEELEEKKRVLRGLQEAATEEEDTGGDEEEEGEEEEVFLKAPVPLRDLLPAAKAHTRWFSGTAAEATFFLPPHLLPTAPPPHMMRVRKGCVYHREDSLRQHAQYLMGAKEFQKRRSAVVSRLEEEMCEELLLRERKTKDKKKKKKKKNGGVELLGGGRDGSECVVDEKQMEEESVLYRRLHVLKSLAGGQYFEAGGPIGLVGWRGKEGRRLEQQQQQQQLQQQGLGGEQNEHQRRTALALGVRRVIHNLVASQLSGRPHRSPLLLGVHAPFSSAATSSVTTTTSSSSSMVQCISLTPSSFSSSTNTVIDGLAEVLMLPELEDLTSNLSPPAVQQVIRQAVACCALVKYNERQAAALLPPVRRRTEERKRKKAAKQQQQQQEDEEGGADKGVSTAMKMMPWPLAIPLHVEWLQPGPVSLAVREVTAPLVSMLKSLLIQGNVVIGPATAAAAAGRGNSSSSSSSSSRNSSSSVTCLPGGVHVEGLEMPSPIFVAAHPLLVQELLSVLCSDVARDALAEELHGMSLHPLLAEAGDPAGGPAAAPAARAPLKVALENLLSSLESMAVPRAHALNRRLVTSNPLIATTRSSSSNSSTSISTKPAIEWCLPLYDRRKAADHSLRDQQRLGCASSQACMESTICRVCTLCVAQHCGCDLSSGAAPNQLAPVVDKERAFFKAMLLVQQHMQQQEQEQSRARKDDGETRKRGRKKEEGDDEKPLPASFFRGLRREEELRLGWESRTLNRTSQAAIEDAVDRERNEVSSTPRLPAHELLVYLKEAAAEKMRVTMSGDIGGRRTTTAAADAGADGGTSGQEQQQRQKLDGNRSDSFFVLGQFNESALVALGVVVEEALEGMVEGMLQQAAVRSWRGSYRGLREETPADVKQTLRAHLGSRYGRGGEMTRGLGGTVAEAEAREEQERNVLWAVFGRTGRGNVKGKRKRTEEGEERPAEDL